MGFYFDKEEWLRITERLIRMGFSPTYASQLAALQATSFSPRRASTAPEVKVGSKVAEAEETVALSDHFSIDVTKITYQPKDEFLRSPSDPAEFELSKAKRAKAWLVVEENSKESKVTAIIEFHGNGLTLTRTDGTCKTEHVGNVLGYVHKTLYPERGKGLKLIGRIEDGKECLYTVDDAGHFSDFLHLMKNAGDKQVEIKVE